MKTPSLTTPDQLTAQQKRVGSFQEGSLHLYGSAGSGKTTAGVARLLSLTQLKYENFKKILILLPQETLAAPFQNIIEDSSMQNSTGIDVLTMSSIVRRMVDLFWPLVSVQAGFTNPYQSPRFLTIETAQYYMGKIVVPLINQGAFSSIALPHHRLFSQLLDNLNKSALVGFSHTEIATRLKSAWSGDSAQLRVYDDVQIAVNLFRDFCLENNFLDLSLQVQLFRDHLWQNPVSQHYLFNQYRHLIYDNVEEDTPFAHDVIQTWLPHFQSALTISDTDAGFRSFLGADPTSALRFQKLSDQTLHFTKNFISTPEREVATKSLLLYAQNANNLRRFLNYFKLPDKRHRFFPEMLSEVCNQVIALVKNKAVPANQIAILSPFISDSMAFSITHTLAKAGIKVNLIKPSSPLNQDPFVRCLITLAVLALPEYGIIPEHTDLVHMLMLAIQDMDAVRADLLIANSLSDSLNNKKLLPVENMSEKLTQRIPKHLLSRYEILRSWLDQVEPLMSLDQFFSRVFGEVLSQPGFGFHQNFQSGVSASDLIESYKKFRAAFNQQNFDLAHVSSEFLNALHSGLLAAQYLSDWQPQDTEAVIISPVLTFLMQNSAVDYQFWLNIGSPAWYERLEQPLTHPYVLSRNWPKDSVWTQENESRLSKTNLTRIIKGLNNRCKKQVYIGFSQFNESGVEEKGLLLKLFQTSLKQGLQESLNG